MRRRTRELFERAKRNNILDESEVRDLLVSAGLAKNEGLQDHAEEAILAKSIENWQYPFSSRTSIGDVELGETFQDQPFYLSQEALTKHLLAVGQTGSGKTTLFYSVMGEVDKPFWAFDLKQDYRHLARDLELLILPWTELRFNPLQPPEGVPPRRWAQVFAEIFGHATALLSGSKNYLMKKLIELYQAYNLFEEVSPPYPSTHELEIAVTRDKINYVRKTSNYRDTVLNRLEAMNLVAGTVFDCSQGYRVEELLERKVVFEFDGLSRDVQNFVMEILFAYVYEYRMAQNQRDSGLNHLFFLDEGKQVFSVYKERQDAAGIPAIDELTAKMREFGEGLVVGDQEASKLTDSIKANTNTKVLLPTGDQKQFDAVANSLDLSERQREYAQELSTGEAIIQVGNNSPVPVKLHNYEIEKTVSDTELENRQAENWAELSHTDRASTPGFKSLVAPNRSDDVEDPDIVDDPQEQTDISDDAQRFLMDVLENPFKSLTERYTEFPSSYKGNKAKNELVDAGILIERRVHTKQGQRKLLELTEKGRNYTEERLDKDVDHRGRGGIVHRYWQHRIKEAYETRGDHAFLEKFDADVYVNMHDSELAVEVAMGDNPREIRHIENHLDRGFQVCIACRNQGILEGLKQRVEEQEFNQDQLTFRLFREFSDEENL